MAMHAKNSAPILKHGDELLSAIEAAGGIQYNKCSALKSNDDEIGKNDGTAFR